jgi:hypothetical protein
MAHVSRVWRTVLGICVAACAVGCGVSYLPMPPGSLIGRARVYDYSPSATLSGNTLQVWWCGSDANLYDRTQVTDTIQYESINLNTSGHDGPLPVLGETQYAWDAVYTCNPRVIRGVFTNPLSNGLTYTYAMYYVATDSLQGNDNRIGVAFSNDGIAWKKYPKPIIFPDVTIGYGVAQPVLYNSDQHSALRMFYEVAYPVSSHIEATSTDGVNFTKVGTLTTAGLDPANPNPSWGDMAYDPQTGYWYAAFNEPFRANSTTGGVAEFGQYGIQMYRIPDASLLTGATPWQLVTTVDTNLTGYESNFIPSFLRDGYGNLNVGPYPSITMYTSISNPPPPWNATPSLAGSYGSISNWDISSATWIPGQPMKALNRYTNGTTHEVTTGWVDPGGKFSFESTLGHLYESPQQGATVPFYGCKSGATDYFVSTDISCAGTRILGVNGYGYSAPSPKLVALYRCSTSTDHFVSNDSGCEGRGAAQLLGYALP